jgi:hypothetical protein
VKPEVTSLIFFVISNFYSHIAYTHFPIGSLLPQPEEHGLLEAFVRELGASKPCEFIFAFGGIFFLFASIC